MNDELSLKKRDQFLKILPSDISLALWSYALQVSFAVWYTVVLAHAWYFTRIKCVFRVTWLFKILGKSDNISETMQDRDIVAMEV